MSGLRTTVSPIADSYAAEMLQPISCMHSGLVEFAGSHVPPAMVFAQRLVSPTLFSATYEYEHVVRSSFHIQSSHVQEDMEYLVQLCDHHPDMDLPAVVAPSLLSYISPSRGFGVFAATDIPEDTDPADKDAARSTPACVGTYGGVVCTYDEIRRHNYAYAMSDGLLPTLLTRHTTEYVHHQHHVLLIDRNIPYVDASVIRAGDGRFLNGSCNPNCAVHAGYYMATHAIPPDTDAPSRYMRQVITVIKATR